MKRKFPGPWMEATKLKASDLSHRYWRLTVALGLPAILTGNAWGQEALRQSLAGDAAVAAQHQSETTIGYYNMRMGDLTLRASTGLGVQYNDNVRLQNSQPQDDFIFVPNVTADLQYPVTQFNKLDLSISAGYTAYAKHPDLSQFYVNPGSGLMFNIYIGDFVINLHDRFSITENGYQNPAVNGNGNGNNSRLENSVGISTTWDLNKLVLTAGYDHGNSLSLGSTTIAPNSASENIFLNAGAKLRPDLLAGLEIGGTSVSYDQSTVSVSPNIQQWSAGAFAQWQISEYLSAQLHLGYTQLLPQSTASTNLNTGTSSGPYFNVALTHRVNQWFTYSLSAERSQNLQSYGQPYTTYSIRWSPNFNLFRKYSVSTPVWWTKGSQFYQQANSYEQYGVSLNVSRQITEKLSGTISYQFIDETSDQANLNYLVDIISLTLAYRF